SGAGNAAARQNGTRSRARILWNGDSVYKSAVYLDAEDRRSENRHYRLEAGRGPRDEEGRSCSQEKGSVARLVFSGRAGERPNSQAVYNRNRQQEHPVGSAKFSHDRRAGEVDRSQSINREPDHPAGGLILENQPGAQKPAQGRYPEQSR